jgi:DNA polymerase-3 subunit delta'
MTVIGHREQQAAFASAVASGRLHHAWLLTGPNGVGKATFADAAVRMLMTGATGTSLTAAGGHPALALLDADSHPDCRRLARTENERGKLRNEIVVEQVRELQGLLQETPAFGGWRTVIVDSADELNRNSANALLKNLEEPPEKTLFLLVSHSPNRLLATIRSRCRVLRFQPLSDGDVREVLTRHGITADTQQMVALSQGAPGRALRFAGLDLGGLAAALDRLAARGDTGEALTLAKSLAGKTAQPRYEAFIELVPAYLSAAARGRTGASLAHTLALWEKAALLAAEALPLAHDPQAVAFELAGYVTALDNPR